MLSNRSPRFLIIGASGMLGTDLSDAVIRRFGQSSLLAPSSSEVNIIQPQSILNFVETRKPDFVFNCAAYTNVDGAETEREKAFQLNARGPANLVEILGPKSIPLIHFSTDHVFDGSGSTPWTEEASPSPANYYGETKWLGDKAILGYQKSLVLRVQWLYGRKKNRFTSLREKKAFTPIRDQFGAPTWTADIAEISLALLEKGEFGLFHLSYDNYASWWDVYSFVKNSLALSTELLPRLTTEISLPARRPKFAVMANAKLKAALGRTELGSWESRLGEFLKIND